MLDTAIYEDLLKSELLLRSQILKDVPISTFLIEILKDVPTISHNWKAKYYGMEVSELKRLKQLEEENRKLKQIVADQALDIQALKHVLSKKY